MPLLSLRPCAVDAVALRPFLDCSPRLAVIQGNGNCCQIRWPESDCRSWIRVKTLRPGPGPCPCPCTPRLIINSASGNSREPPQSTSKSVPFEWDPFEDLFGLGVDLRSRKNASKQKSEQDESERGVLSGKVSTCPTCKGRGYLDCTRCNSKNLDASCPQCSGKGYVHCWSCQGQFRFPEDTENESTWASLQSRLPIQIAEDEAIERVATSPVPKRKTRRVYGPLPPETKDKIRRALKELETRTGSISQRLREQHRDPVLHAQRSAAIKKARGTDEARKRTSEKLKEYFTSEANRMKRSRRMKGVRYTCSACGEEGHRRHFCPKLGFSKERVEKAPSYHCSHCGQIGHRAPQCPQLLASQPVSAASPATREVGSNTGQRRLGKGPWCAACHAFGHTKAHCPTTEMIKKRRCRVCGNLGHNSRTCSASNNGTL